MLFNTVLDKKQHVFNFLILIAKHYIYVSRCLDQTPTFEQLHKKIFEVMQIEEFIAKKSNRWNPYVFKWKIVKPSLQLQQSNDSFVHDYLAQLTL